MIRRVVHAALPLLAIVIGAPQPARAQSVFFQEDFAGFEIGDAATDWGPNSVVLMVPGGKDKRKFLSTQIEGEETVEKAMSFPASWTFRFDAFFSEWGSQTKILLVDSEDNPLEILAREHYGARFKMPNTVEIEKDGRLFEPGRAHRVSVVRKDKTIKLFWDDELILASNYPSLGKVVRVKIKFKAGSFYTGFVAEERPS